MSEDARQAQHPFAGFRVADEPMGDGRRIRYYEWPADADSGVGEAPAEAGRDGDRDGDE